MDENVLFGEPKLSINKGNEKDKLNLNINAPYDMNEKGGIQRRTILWCN